MAQINTVFQGVTAVTLVLQCLSEDHRSERDVNRVEPQQQVRGRKVKKRQRMRLDDLRQVRQSAKLFRRGRDTHAQDLIEYALMAGFVAVAAGAIMPGVSTSISRVFSKVSSVMTAASSQS